MSSFIFCRLELRIPHETRGDFKAHSVDAAGDTRRSLPRRGGAAPRRTHQRAVDRRRFGGGVSGGLPLLQPVHRHQGDEAGRRPRHSGGGQQRRPELRADQQERAVRPPLRRHRRRRAAGGAGAGRAGRLPARHAVAAGRRGAGGGGAGLYGAVHLLAPQRRLAR